MIVKNEEDVLKRCLDSIADLVDEIIIIDTGSTDKTKEIAASYTPHVFDFEWIDHFSAARNFAFSKASKDYCLWLDADDVVFPKDRQLLRTLKKELDPNVDIVMCKYNIAFNELQNPTFSYFRERIIKNNQQLLFKGAVHEAIVPVGKIIHSDFAVSHQKIHIKDSKRNLKIYEKLLDSGESLTARDLYYYARELYYHQSYDKAIQYFNQFLAHPHGWLENKIEACQILSYCYNQISKPNLALDTLLHSLTYDTPRAEICCDIGHHFFHQQHYQLAIFWYQMATSIKYNPLKKGFTVSDSYNYTPYLQLCVCYHKLGDLPKAIEYNEKAGEVKPNDPLYLRNKNYFDNLK